MTERITAGMTASDVLASIESIANRLSNTQEELASGERINSPEDDPYGTAESLFFRGDLAQTKQYETNVGEATSWLNVTGAALGNVSDLVERARDLVVEAGGGSLSSSDLQSISDEMSQIIDSIKTEANTQYAGRYVFGGTKTTTAPYQLGADDTYAGNSGAVNRQIGPGVSLQVNSIGLTVFGGIDPSGGATDTGLLGTLRTIVTDLDAGNTANLQGTDLKAIDTDNDTLLDQRAVVGARSNRATSASNRLSQIEEVSTQQLSNTEDADMAQTLTDLSQEQAVYQAALQAGAQLVQPSLMDFLSTG